MVWLQASQPAYRILVVDDQPVNRQLLAVLFTRVGLEVHQAEDGNEALRVWQTWQPHLIWMDLQMPKMDGYEVTRQIRQMEQQQMEQQISRSTGEPQGCVAHHPTKIIALTAQAFTDDRDRAIAAGCDDFVTKPFQQDALFGKLAEHLNLQYVYAEEYLETAVSSEMPLDPPQFPLRDRTHQRLITHLRPADLHVMPSEWITALYRAALGGYSIRLDALIQQIPAEHTSLAAELERLNYEYQYEVIMQLSQPDPGNQSP